MSDRFIVMISQECMPASMKFGASDYYKIAVVETNGTRPKQINPRHKSVKRIVKMWRKCHSGKTDKCAFERYHKEAKELASKLNDVAEYI